MKVSLVICICYYIQFQYVNSCFWSRKKNIYNLIKPSEEDCPFPFKRQHGICTYVSNGIYSFYKGREICHSLEGFLAEPVNRDEIEYLNAIKEAAKVELGTKIALSRRRHYKYFAFEVKTPSNETQSNKTQSDTQSNTTLSDDTKFNETQYDKSVDLQTKLSNHYWLGGSYMLGLRDFSCADFQNFAPMWPTGNRVIQKWARVPPKSHNCSSCSLLDLAREGLVAEECDQENYIICEYNSMHKFGIYSN
ncbi:UNVERIFIED_CONTAM: hypothetical protein RMT77_012512 [Armadillidium vulgare]